MPRPRKRTVLETLSKARLIEIARAFDLGVPASESKESFVNAIGQSKAASFRRVLRKCSLDDLRSFCDEYDLPRSGSKPEVIARLLGEDEEETTQHDHLPLFSGAAAEPPAPTASSRPSNSARTSGRRETLSPVAPTQEMPLKQKATEDGGGENREPRDGPDAESVLGALVVRVQRRKPRLAWNGMERRELASFVPTQVVEIVSPGLARANQLAGLDTRTVASSNRQTLPPNRLIWTNDNLVALRTLLDERDPITRDYKYRDRIDLVYIDPPFMVNNDFRGDNSIDVDLDSQAGVSAKKEPSLVEILAYRDTWREGLDSFLTMLRTRLLFLRDLLSPSGSIYVHLDWHAVHYVKVLLDEIFGYENFQNEISWKRSSAHSDSSQGARHYGRVTDTILFYSKSGGHYWDQQYGPYDPDYVAENYKRRDPDGRIYRIGDLSGPGGAAKGNPRYEFLGVTRYWRYGRERMEQLYREGRIEQTRPGAVPQYKRYLDEMPGVPLQSVWTDVQVVNNRSREFLGFPTQKPIELLERIISVSCPPGGTVLDCFAGSGSTAEAAERLGRNWIGIDNSKFAIHVARKRLIELDGTPIPSRETSYKYDKCDHCKQSYRQEVATQSPGLFEVRPFSVENMGVYQRAEAWQDFQTQRNRYRDEMVRVFGGDVVTVSPLLHGIKRGAWIHIGPLDAPVAVPQVWSIAREAQRTDRKRVEILSADFNTLAESERNEVKEATGVQVTIRIIPKSAIDEVARRIRLQHTTDEEGVETMAIPAFYAPLSIVLARKVSGRSVRLDLSRCEVDIESFLASQRPIGLKSPDQASTAKQREKANAEMEKWLAREKVLEEWLAKANTWQKFVDFWAVDWDYGRRIGPDEKPIFETQWQSFRVRKSKTKVEEFVFHAEFTYSEPGKYRIAARVTDVFGNDGIATVTVNIR